MNNDRRRILGPSDARIPQVGTQGSETTGISTTKHTTNKPNDNKFYCKTNHISNANGSSYVESHENIVTVSVFGPRPLKSSFVDQASVSVEVKFLPHLANETDGNPNGKTGLTLLEHQISQFIETCLVNCILLNKYPKSTIDLHVSVLEYDGNVMELVKWIVVGCSLGLVDSGIEIKDMITPGYIQSSKDDMEVDNSVNTIDCLVCFMNLKDEIVGIWVDGSVDDLQNSIEECNEISKQIRSNLNSYLVQA